MDNKRDVIVEFFLACNRQDIIIDMFNRNIYCSFAGTTCADLNQNGNQKCPYTGKCWKCPRLSSLVSLVPLEGKTYRREDALQIGGLLKETFEGIDVDYLGLLDCVSKALTEMGYIYEVVA